MIVFPSQQVPRVMSGSRTLSTVVDILAVAFLADCYVLRVYRKKS